jgi:hypothetical protein
MTTGLASDRVFCKGNKSGRIRFGGYQFIIAVNRKVDAPGL